jgi:transcriptional regulator with XRE-family HTH domain
MSSGDEPLVSILCNVIRIQNCDNGNMPRIMNPKLPRREGKLFIKEWLAYRNMTAEKLAEHLDSSKSAVSKVAGGQQRYNQDWLELIAHALQCDVRSLFRDPREPSADELLDQLTPEDRQTAMILLESYTRDRLSRKSNPAQSN